MLEQNNLVDSLNKTSQKQKHDMTDFWLKSSTDAPLAFDFKVCGATNVTNQENINSHKLTTKIIGTQET